MQTRMVQVAGFFAVIAFCGVMAIAQSGPVTSAEPAASGVAARPMMGSERVPPPNPAQLMLHSGGSLFRASQPPRDLGQAKMPAPSFYAVPEPKPKEYKKHDLVSIVIRELSESSSTGTSDLKKSADLDAKIDQYVSLRLSQAQLKQINSPLEVKASGSRNSKGEATVDRSDSVTDRVTAEVIDIKPNNTLVLQAHRHIKQDDEEHDLVLTGTCRVEDVTPDNTILSTQLHDQNLVKISKGAVKDTTERGLIPRILDGINPF